MGIQIKETTDETPKRELTDEEFLSALIAGRGLYSETARFIRRYYSITYSRQAVKQRADRNFKENVQEIRESNLDKAEDTILSLMSPAFPARVRLQAATWYLRKQGKERGYADGLDININETIVVEVEDEKPPMWLTVDITQGKETG